MLIKMINIPPCLLALALVSGCATAVIITGDSINAQMASIKNEINLNRESINKLKNTRVGATGFFYVIDTDGSVVFHPQSAIIGSSFKNHWFINKILEEKTGCLTYQLGNRTHVIFFDQLNDSEMLCLSIVSDDLQSLPAHCRQKDVK